jgi:Tol biopolymer transport system component
MGADGSNPTNLTKNDSAEDDSPSFSQQGTEIVFASDRDGNSEIYLMGADGSDQSRLTHNPAPDTDPAFVLGYAAIAFASKRDGDFDVYVMNVDPDTMEFDDSNSTHITDNAQKSDLGVTFADYHSNRMAYVSAQRDDTGKVMNELHVRDIDGSYHIVMHEY